MVRCIKFPLEMENGVKVRTLEELRKNFSIEKVMLNYINGKLFKWLVDRGYEYEAKKIKEIDNINEVDIPRYICQVFKVEYNHNINLDIKSLKNREGKINILKIDTKDDSIIEKVDNIAFNQEELLNILDKGEEEICLYNNNFEIPLDKENINYTGIKNAIINLNIDDISILGKKNIKFKDIIIKNNDEVIEINKRDIKVFVKRKDNKIELYGRDKITGEEFRITNDNEKVEECEGLEENAFIKYNNKLVYFIETEEVNEEIERQYGIYNELIFRDLDTNSRIKVSMENVIFGTNWTRIVYLNEDYLVLRDDGCTYLFNCKTYELIKIAEEDKLFRGRKNEAVLDKYFVYLKEGKIYIKDIATKSEEVLNLQSYIDSICVSENYIYYIEKSSYSGTSVFGKIVLGRINIIDFKSEVLGYITEFKIGDSFAIYTRNDDNILWGKSSGSQLIIGMFNINKKEIKKLNESFVGSILKAFNETQKLQCSWEKYFNK